MLRRLTFPATLLLLGYFMWLGSSFMQLALGVAFFIFGMLCLEDGFKLFAGGLLEKVMQASTSRLWKSLSLGFISTTLMQSSTLVSLISISFVSSEIISLAAGLGILLGANIGTSTGAWLIAGLGLKVEIASYATPLLVFGVLFLMQKRKAFKGAGYLLLGLGFLFLGIHYMKEGFSLMQESFSLADYSLGGVGGLLLFTLIGTLITFIMQSSHATLLIVIAALATNQVTYENALALAIGASLGSAITSALGGLAANIGGKRLAVGQVIFSGGATFLALVFIQPFTQGTDYLAPYLGIAADDYLLKMALFQTLFRTFGSIVFLPFLSSIEQLLLKLLKPSEKNIEKPLYLYPEALETASSAVVAARKEVTHLFDNVFKLLIQGLSLDTNTIREGLGLSEAINTTKRIYPLDVENAYEENIKNLHSEIVFFITKALSNKTSRTSSEELYRLRQASLSLVKAVKGMKHLHNNLSRYGLSNKPAVREKYDQIRLYLARLLNQLHEITQKEETLIANLELDALRLALQKASNTMANELDELIRYRKISPLLATSIMNDQSYVIEIAKNLISTVEALYSTSNESDAPQLTLNTLEIENLAKESSQEKANEN